MIHPDRYVGKKAVNKDIYQLNSEVFYKTMQELSFEFNPTFRSNYPTTLPSNSTLFTAQHHHLQYEEMNNELLQARDLILGDNPVLQTFKNNGYETNLILEHASLALNVP